MWAVHWISNLLFLLMQKTLSDWLIQLKKSDIKLGLERINQVYQSLVFPLDSTIITIGGTNGKGSTTAFLENIYLQSGFSVGKLSSPELWCYNEQIQINGTMASDEHIVEAFEVITQAKKDVDLSYFEYLTLSALWLFKQHKVDIILLEVGLGGRLDAVNVVDCDCAVITNIALDHCHILGDTREAIAQEKIAIARANTPFICSDKQPPNTLLDYLKTHHIPATFITNGYQGCIGLLGKHQAINAQLAITVVNALLGKRPVLTQVMKSAIATTKLLGRLQHITRKHQLFILDVAHNPASAKTLAQHLKTLNNPVGQTMAIFCALKDKNIEAIIDKISPLVCSWHLCPLLEARFSMNNLLQRTQAKLSMSTQTPASTIVQHHTMLDALKFAWGSRITQVVIFGSFQTVANALKHLQND